MNNEHLLSFFAYLQSQQTTQSYLKHCYQKLSVVDAEKKSYQNANAFLYYLSHGSRFYESGKKMDTMLQPILYFYGMVHLLKACLLTVRPDYPESTSMLAHGVSARKRKKKHYLFSEDEVRTQHNGLLPYVTKHLFQLKYLPFEKVNMGKLLGLIPELSPMFTFEKKQKLFHVGNRQDRILQFPPILLDQYHLTEQAFIQRIKGYFPNDSVKPLEQVHNTAIVLKMTAAIDEAHSPFFFDSNQQIYFPADREHCLSIPEAVVHYLILYNLSMLSRYEAEWWGELLVVKSDMDYPLITQFLQVTAEKMPIYLGQLLYKQFS